MDYILDILAYIEVTPHVFLTLVGLLGLFIGSFLNVCIYRLPIMMHDQWEDECREYLGELSAASLPDAKPRKKMSLWLPASFCPQCDHKLSMLDNIPILSYIALLGRCRFCRSPISARYPFVELLTACASVFVAYWFGYSLQTAALLLLTWGLIAQMFIDIDHYILLDDITLPLLWIGLAISLVPVFVSPEQAILGAFVGYSSLWLVAHAFLWITRRQGMGHGDFKLFALFGAWLGVHALPFIILLASMVGAVFGIVAIISKLMRREEAIPFGPYLAVAGWMTFFIGGRESLEILSRVSETVFLGG